MLPLNVVISNSGADERKQGGQIFDNAVCGGPDTGASISTTASPLTAAAQAALKAVILMGDPRYVAGLPYNVGTCTTNGVSSHWHHLPAPSNDGDTDTRAHKFDARPKGYTCPVASKIKSYCDSADPYCCTGNDANVHQGYGAEYGQQALAFVKTMLTASGGTTPTPTSTTTAGSTPPATSAPSTGCAALYGQCGGQSWAGATCCSAGTCKAANSYYSQCLN